MNSCCSEDNNLEELMNENINNTEINKNNENIKTFRFEFSSIKNISNNLFKKAYI